LSTLMLAGIRELLTISTPRDVPMIRDLLGDGSDLGLSISYAEQLKPEGIAQAFIIGAEVYAYRVSDPERYGVVSFDETGRALTIEEKPKDPQSSWAVTGLYLYDASVVDIAQQLKPSARGELEITDVNRAYLAQGRLLVRKFGRGVAWLDSGTYDSLIQASLFVQTVEQRQGLKVACVEEIAFLKGFIDAAQLQRLAEALSKSPYGAYLKQVLNESRGPTP
jgi:glucose-1-phosphate thymidylyltransferase